MLPKGKSRYKVMYVYTNTEKKVTKRRKIYNKKEPKIYPAHIDAEISQG